MGTLLGTPQRQRLPPARPHCQDPPRCPAHLQERPHLRNPGHHWTSPYSPDRPPANCPRDPHPHRPGCLPGCCHPRPRCLPCPSRCSCCCPPCPCCLCSCPSCCCCCPSCRCLSSVPSLHQYLKVKQREDCTTSRVQ